MRRAVLAVLLALAVPLVTGPRAAHAEDALGAPFEYRHGDLALKGWLARPAGDPAEPGSASDADRRLRSGPSAASSGRNATAKRRLRGTRH